MSFDNFCDEILPYRLSHEPIEYWKEDYYEVFRPVIDTVSSDLPLEKICLTLLQYLKDQQYWTAARDFQCYGLGTLTLLHTRHGNCQEGNELLTYMLRFVGIPSGIDLVLQDPNSHNKKHLWTYFRNTTGKCISFDYFQTNPFNKALRKYGKIYRQCYALQKESLPQKYKEVYIPPVLDDELIRYVSFEFIKK